MEGNLYTNISIQIRISKYEIEYIFISVLVCYVNIKIIKRYFSTFLVLHLFET